MKISEKGLNLIKQFEGCPLTAYKDPVGIPTIGYGHTKSVKLGMKITQAQADAYLKQDIAIAEEAVNNLPYDLNINQFSALVSFTFNCGTKNLKKLTDSNKRTLAQISARIPNYNRADGNILPGLTRRRAAEKALFDTPCEAVNSSAPTADNKAYFKTYKGTSGSIVTALNAIGANSTLTYRKTIAKANNIANYSGTYAQNVQMLKLLKAGKLIKP